MSDAPPLRPDRTRVLLLVFILVAPFIGLGAWPLIDPDEARTAEVAREMLATGDWIVPRINGLPRLDKPVIPYAATAVSIAVLGPSPLSARLPAALATALTCLLLALSLRSHLGPDGALLAAGITAASPLVLIWSRGGTIDAILLLCMTTAFIGFWRAMQEDRARWAVLAWLGMAIGVLTKGPVALIPLGVAAAHSSLQRSGLRRLFPLPGIIAAAAVVLPWVMAVERQFPDFLEYVVSVETVARTTTTELHRTGPMALPLAALVLGAMPWIVLPLRGVLVPSQRHFLRDSPLARYAALWLILPLILFTIVSSRRVQYVLPLIPAVAILASMLCPADTRARRVGGVIAILTGAMLIAALPIARTRVDVPLYALATLTLGAGAAWILAGMLYMRGRTMGAAAALATFPIAMIPFLAVQGKQLGGEETARELRRRGLADAPIFGLHTYSPSLAFELNRTYGLITHHGRELGGNYINRHFESFVDAEESPLRSRGWYERNLQSCAQPMIVIARSDDRSTVTHLYESRIPILFRTSRFLVAQPCPPPSPAD